MDRPSTRDGGFDHCSSPTRCRSCWSRRCTTSRHGTRPCARAPGGSAGAGIGERIRRALDLEHWAAFNESFRRMVRPARARSARAGAGTPPATIIAIGGDVHHAYLAEVAFPPGCGAKSAVYQAVCSPFRNALDAQERTVVRTAARRGAGAVCCARWPARPACPTRSITWRLAQSPDLRQPVRDARARWPQRRAPDRVHEARRSRQPQHRDVTRAAAGVVNPKPIPFLDLARQHAEMRAELQRGVRARARTTSAFILGEEVERFEEEFAAYCGVRALRRGRLGHGRPDPRAARGRDRPRATR